MHEYISVHGWEESDARLRMPQGQKFAVRVPAICELGEYLSARVSNSTASVSCSSLDRPACPDERVTRSKLAGVMAILVNWIKGESLTLIFSPPIDPSLHSSCSRTNKLC